MASPPSAVCACRQVRLGYTFDAGPNAVLLVLKQHTVQAAAACGRVGGRAWSGVTMGWDWEEQTGARGWGRDGGGDGKRGGVGDNEWGDGVGKGGGWGEA